MGEPARVTGLLSDTGPRQREGCCLSLPAAAKRPHHHDGPERNHTIPRQPHSPRTTDPALPTLHARTWVEGRGSPRAHPVSRPCSWPGTSRPSLYRLLHVQSQTSPSQISTKGHDSGARRTEASPSVQKACKARAQTPVRGRQAPGPLGRWGRPLHWHPGPRGLASLCSFCLSSQTQLPACASARGANRPPRIHVLGRDWEPPCSCPRENTLFPSRRKRPSGGSGHTGRRRLSGQRARGCSTQLTADSRLLSAPAIPAAHRRARTPALSPSALSP